MKQGRFIVIQGLDRSGKSSIAEKMVKLLIAPVILMSFPNRQTYLGKMINDVLKNKSEFSAEGLHLLFSANRWEQNKHIKETLAKNVSIVCDRYWYSGVAYSAAKGLDIDWCMQADRGLVQPDLILYLRGNPQTLTFRQGYGEEIFQRVQFQKEVQKQFDSLFNKRSNVQIIDIDNKNLEEVWEEVKSKVKFC